MTFCRNSFRNFFSSSEGFKVIATSARASHIVYDVDLHDGPLAIAVGNETEGMSEVSRAAASDFVALPMASDGASSLNVTVAAGVLLYEALRQRRNL
jgi:23S rRNA (guanosine2251-2'-O)-methyltransferase